MEYFDSFNASHTHAYSLVALQEMNLCYKNPIIFWNCSCLITDSGGEGASTDYNKIARAIGKMRSSGINIGLPNINTSMLEFRPDVDNNIILSGLKNLANVGDDVVNNIIKNRPYTSIKDFLTKVKPNKQAVISLIKAGAFDSLMDRKLCMAWYIWQTCNKKNNLTLQNMGSLIKYNLIPIDTVENKNALRIYEFNRYLKAKCASSIKDVYKLDCRAISFMQEFGYDSLITIFKEEAYVKAKEWDKVYQKWMDIIREWLSHNKEQTLKTLNDIIFKEDWNKYAAGSYSTWEMASLCFYYHEHELANINQSKYGFVDFDKLPETPEIAKVFKKNGKEINMYNLCRIAGTCIAKNKAKSIVTLLTPTGVVDVKFSKEHFSMFDKQISRKNADGTKTIMERSWFNRGSMIVINGVRIDNNFIVKKYSSTIGHRLYKIDTILPNGDLTLRSERYQGEEEEDEE